MYLCKEKVICSCRVQVDPSGHHGWEPHPCSALQLGAELSFPLTVHAKQRTVKGKAGGRGPQMLKFGQQKCITTFLKVHSSKHNVRTVKKNKVYFYCKFPLEAEHSPMVVTGSAPSAACGRNCSKGLLDRTKGTPPLTSGGMPFVLLLGFQFIQAIFGALVLGVVDLGGGEVQGAVWAFGEAIGPAEGLAQV